MNYLAPIPKQFVDQSGIPYSGGKVTVYNHGNTTKATIYTDASGNTISTNPVVLDSNGAWKAYVLAMARYDYVVEDKNGNVVFTFQDVAVPVDSDFDPSVVASEYSPEATYPAGSIVFKDGELYKALTDIDTPEDWDPWHWGRTDITDCMPILFECTEPNWPDPELMFEAVKAGRLAGICRTGTGDKAIWALAEVVDNDSPETYMMEFRHPNGSECDVTVFRRVSDVWTTSSYTYTFAPKVSVCRTWNSVTTYPKDALVYHGDKVYRSLVANPSHTWDASEWIETTIAAEVQNAGSFDSDIIAPAYSSSNTYVAGMLCMYNDELYCCIRDITTPETWDSGHWERKSISGYGPVVFRCNAPNWPDPSVMFNVCMNCKEAFISRMGEGAEVYAIWRLVGVFRRESPAMKQLEFERIRSDYIERVVFDESGGTWSTTESSVNLTFKESIAPNWSSSDSPTYGIGTLVWYNNVLYRCKVHPASSGWVAAEWEATTVAAAKAPKTVYITGTAGSPPPGASVDAAVSSDVDVVISIIAIGGYRQDLYFSNIVVGGALLKDIYFASTPRNGKCYTLHYSTTDGGETWTATYSNMVVENNVAIIEGDTNNTPPNGTLVHAAYTSGQTPIVKVKIGSDAYRVYHLVYANTYGTTYRRYYFASVDANNATIYSILYLSSDAGSTFTTTEYDRPYTIRSTIAPDFSIAAVEDQYPVGSLVYHQNSYGANKLYRCTTANDGGMWDPSDWTETTVADELNRLAQNLT